jgi:excisionase family DNA binding protein
MKDRRENKGVTQRVAASAEGLIVDDGGKSLELGARVRPGTMDMRVAAASWVHCLPAFLTAAEVADLLRTTRKAIYARAERGLLPGVIRLGRRLLIDRDELLRWLAERRAASPGGTRR